MALTTSSIDLLYLIKTPWCCWVTFVKENLILLICLFHFNIRLNNCLQGVILKRVTSPTHLHSPPPSPSPTPTHPKYTSIYPHPPPLTHKKYSPAPTHPKYTSTHSRPPVKNVHPPHPPKIYLHSSPSTPTHP